MKKIFLVCLWAVFCCPALSAQNFKTIRPGVEYAEATRGTEAEPVRINLLRLDLAKVRLDVVHAMDAAIGLEKTSSMVARHGALAAINGGFFRLDKSLFAGDAAGVLQIDGKLLSESYGDRIALGITNGKDKTEVAFAHVETDIWFTYFTDITVDLCGINRERKENEMIVYTPEFHRTTLTNADGTEIVYNGCGPCRQNNIYENKGSTTIPTDGFIVSVSKNSYKYIIDSLKKEGLGSWAGFGSKVSSIEKENKRDFEKVEDIVGGVPQLIKNGKIEITWEEEKSSKAFVETRHPRTAAAKLKDGKFLMATIDGRQPGYSVGMNLNELAAFLLEIGAVEAMNLDGGGSTTMFLDGRIVNRPSDKEGERAVGDAILVFPRK